MQDTDEYFIYKKIKNLLQVNEIPFNELRHDPEGRTINVSKLRGNRLSQAAKAMVLQVKLSKDTKSFVLAIIPGDRKLDFKKIAFLLKAKSVRLAPPDQAEQLTQCKMGSVPPFSFDKNLKILADPLLKENSQIVFNAGKLDRSIVLNCRSYFELARPKIAEITTSEDSFIQKGGQS